MTTTVRLDRLLGREVHTAYNRRLGRLEEFLSNPDRLRVWCPVEDLRRE
jgi:hypothetical protein